MERPGLIVMKFGSCATEYFEPCQILTEAALRSTLCVPQGCLDRAMNPGFVRKRLFEQRCTALILNVKGGLVPSFFTINGRLLYLHITKVGSANGLSSVIPRVATKKL